MIALASDWLALALLLCVFAWFAGRWLAVALPLVVTIAAFAVYLPTGTPRFTSPPPGKYTIIGADIQVDVAIYALIKADGVPVYYRLPYTTSQANALQAALNGAQDGQGVQAIVGQDGGVSYDGDPPVTGLPPKQAEQPAVTLP
jgi:hypothetical protein